MSKVHSIIKILTKDKTQCAVLNSTFLSTFFYFLAILTFMAQLPVLVGNNRENAAIRE